MPIYAYKCSACGHAQDILQKMSDPLLTVCPECGQSTYTKQVTAAGFQLKGSGWYVTDFRNNGAASGAPAGAAAKPAAPGGDAKGGGATNDGAASGAGNTGGNSNTSGGNISSGTSGSNATASSPAAPSTGSTSS
ncbi:FmdB family zinc ribbon protein [Pollutimonas bauzanensis]|uniref:Putative regulatory protein, FmdB family n=1 Tax=Pollutimonas bauzanensis TaxID=658167 RepID=A0A1M5Y464_9BURK|nr:zinc ribbon domain-containing protein [Pollutimonas bauzanensis]SHI06861.1 putative regulatory protein, FmdB family [Pollutimonas bauzanensis]